jgi:antitoxin YqcF
MDLKDLAHRLRDLFGGTPKVWRYRDDDDVEWVDILSSDDRPQPGLTSYATLGMSRFDNEVTTADDVPIRVELVAACQSEFTAMANVLATCAFNVASGKFSITPDVIIPDAIRVNDDTVPMKHALLTTPFLWGDGQPETITEPDTVIAFLQVVPVGDDEFEFARENGVDALTDRYEERQIDIFDINRPSVV